MTCLSEFYVNFVNILFHGQHDSSQDADLVGKIETDLSRETDQRSDRQKTQRNFV